MSRPEAPGPACPEWGDWLEYHFEASAWQERLNAHLAGCADCRRMLADIERRLAAGTPDAAPPLPERFWDDQRRDILARLPRRSGGVRRYWPAMAAAVCTLLLGGALLWRPAAPPAPAQEDRLLEKVIDRAAASPSREWVRSLGDDPELSAIRDLSRGGGPL